MDATNSCTNGLHLDIGYASEPLFGATDATGFSPVNLQNGCSEAVGLGCCGGLVDVDAARAAVARLHSDQSSGIGQLERLCGPHALVKCTSGLRFCRHFWPNTSAKMRIT